MPKYFWLENLLRERLRQCRLGDRLPSEHVLTREFRVSRVTLQRALARLVNDGLITRRQGKGTFYTGEPAKRGHTLSGALESLMRYEGGAHARIIEKRKWVQAPADVAERFNQDVTEAVVVFRRVAYVAGEPFVYIVSYLPYDIGIKVYNDDKVLEHLPMISVLRERHGVSVARVIQTIEATLVDGEVAKRLRVRIGSPVLLAERIYFSRNRKVVQVSRSWYRADRHKYTVTLRRWKPPGPSRESGPRHRRDEIADVRSRRTPSRGSLRIPQTLASWRRAPA